MLRAILGIFTGGLAGQLQQAWATYEAAQTAEARMEAMTTIQQLQSRQSALAMGGRMTALVQALFALPFIVYNIKLVVFDKVLSMGATDPLSPQLYAVEAQVIGFYFLATAAQSIISRLKG